MAHHLEKEKLFECWLNPDTESVSVAIRRSTKNGTPSLILIADADEKGDSRLDSQGNEIDGGTLLTKNQAIDLVEYLQELITKI